MDDREFPEILVKRDQNSSLTMGARQDFFVSRVATPIAGPDHIVA
jgi:hypothetical protein